ncbi:MAG: RNA polymerase sigma factor [Planctomycetota bacterium]
MTTTTTQSQRDLARLVQEHQASVWRYLRYLGCDPATADDLTQETFLAVLRSPFEQRAPEATAGYLRRTALSIYCKVERRDRKLRVLDADTIERMEAAWEVLHGGSARADRDANGDEVLARLRECLAALAPRARDAIRRTYELAEPGAAVASALEIGAGALRVLLHRTRQTLRECVERKMTKQNTQPGAPDA